MLTLQIPTGSYWITGKLFMNGSPEGNASVSCDVVTAAGDILDITNGELPPDNLPFAFAAPVTFNAASSVSLKCDSQQALTAFNVKLAAIKTGNLTPPAIPPP